MKTRTHPAWGGVVVLLVGGLAACAAPGTSPTSPGASASESNDALATPSEALPDETRAPATNQQPSEDELAALRSTSEAADMVSADSLNEGDQARLGEILEGLGFTISKLDLVIAPEVEDLPLPNQLFGEVTDDTSGLTVYITVDVAMTEILVDSQKDDRYTALPGSAEATVRVFDDASALDYQAIALGGGRLLIVHVDGKDYREAVPPEVRTEIETSLIPALIEFERETRA